MKMRRHRKLALAKVRRANAWNWSFNRFVRAVVKAGEKFDAHLQQAMGAPREDMTYTRVRLK